MISEKYCAQHPEWAASRIDDLEAQVVAKFFAPPPADKERSSFRELPPTKEEIERALAFVDALDYSYGYIKWVDAMKVLAIALRRKHE
jgi:hypothetical protein